MLQAEEMSIEVRLRHHPGHLRRVEACRDDKPTIDWGNGSAMTGALEAHSVEFHWLEPMKSRLEAKQALEVFFQL